MKGLRRRRCAKGLPQDTVSTERHRCYFEHLSYNDIKRCNSFVELLGMLGVILED